MCQANCGPALVACSRCGAGFYENDPHTCKVRIPFEEWDADLQRRAKEPLSSNSLIATMQRATQSVAAWPEWKRRYVWAEYFRYSVVVS